MLHGTSPACSVPEEVFMRDAVDERACRLRGDQPPPVSVASPSLVPKEDIMVGESWGVGALAAAAGHGYGVCYLLPLP